MLELQLRGWGFGLLHVAHTHVPQSVTHTHTSILWPSGLCPGLPGWAGTRASLDFTEARDSAPRSRQLTTTTSHHSSFYRPDALPATKLTVSKHWRHARRHASVIKRYKLLPVKEQWCCVAGNVTVGMASHWAWINASVVYPPAGSRPTVSKGDEHPTYTAY